MKQIAVIGAGSMARVRARALLATGQAQICAVAARHQASAEAFGAEIGCARCYDDFRRVVEASPQAVLVEVPHAAQDEIVLWALATGLPVLIGGSLASSVRVGEAILQLSEARGLVVEAGYDARYHPVWEAAREELAAGRIGRLVAARAIALWDGDPATWYYSQQLSGGMPLTHMTYCFLNPLRWLLGEPTLVSAFANRKAHTAPGLIEQETCLANLLFPDDVPAGLTAGFVKPEALPAWSVTFLGTTGALEVTPVDLGGGTLTLYDRDGARTRDFTGARDAFEAQAAAFLGALDGADTCRNTPRDTLGDLRIAEAIVASVREQRTIALGVPNE
jgi:predicted dehydrogenase